jgi:thiamine biosynthesis lipoprotein
LVISEHEPYITKVSRYWQAADTCETTGTMRNIKTILLLASCLISACDSGSTGATHARTIIALGTIIEIEIIGADKTKAERALDEVETFFHEIQRDWYAFGDGELGRANKALAQGNSVELSPALAALVRRSLTLRKLSDGFFDPTVGGLVELWGFDDAENMRKTPPGELEIRSWIAQLPARNSLKIENQLVSAEGPLKLDFGGIAKGTALAGAAALLREKGIDNAIINAGGDLVVLGIRGNRRWRIGIRDPESDGVLGAVALAPGEAIVTSGNYERFFNVGDQRYHHLLDPHTGQPVTETASVTVVDFDPELADAAATALMAAGPKHFRRIARQMGVECAMLVTTAGEILMTARMAERIERSAALRQAWNPAWNMNKTLNLGEFPAISRV